MNGFKRLDKNSVMFRTASFQQCAAQYSVPSLTLARLGFMYDADRQVICCISCGYIHNNLGESGDLSSSRHFLENPRCRFSTEIREVASNSPRAVRKAAQDSGNSRLNGRLDLRNSGEDEVDSRSYDVTDGIGASTGRLVKESRTSRNDFVDPGPEPLSSAQSSTVQLSKLNSRLVRFDEGKARHPEMIPIEKRINSFTGNEMKFKNKNIPVNEYAAAGLYYLGPDDNVRCFYCDGGLKNFTPTDNPWLEHKHYYPNCDYVKAVSATLANQTAPYSSDLAAAVPSSATSLYSAAEPTSASAARAAAGPAANRTAGTAAAGLTRSSSTLPPAASQPSVNSAAAVTPKYVLDPRELKARLETPTIQLVLKMGFSRDEVKAALQKRFTVVGDDYPGIEPLMIDLYDAREESEALSSSRPSTSAYSDHSEHDSSGGTYFRTAGNVPTNSLPASSATSNLSQVPKLSTSNNSASSNVSNSSAATVTSESTNRSTLTGSSESLSGITRTSGLSSVPSSTSLMKDSACSGNLAADSCNESACAVKKSRGDTSPKDAGKTTSMNAAENITGETTDEEDIDSLKTEYEELKRTRVCKVCLTEESDTVFLPCGHFVCCGTCAPKISHCCCCRSLIQGTVKALLMQEEP